ncbi:MAG: adenylyltransferase/cytidyltransferase family protein [Candidatus Poseidonia sp.]|nr:adenylyltransferase/cytidyltransferase family protein [Poseidonia sp.]
MNIITFGTFDCFHIGHLNIFKRIKDEFPDSRLIVGISTDELNYSKKQRVPIVSFTQREEIVSSIRYVDETFPEESLEEKAEYLAKYDADVLVMGDDHHGLYDHFNEICRVWYLPRTPQISTTALIEKIILEND